MPPERIHPRFIILLSSPPQAPSDSLDSSFPIVTISVIGILATAILLLCYYAFVTNCCLNWQQSNTINRLYWSRRRHSRRIEDLFALHSVMLDACGLDELTIQAIPTFRYRRGQVQGSSNECAVCLNDFQEEERVRLLPDCLHVFHIDCIDAWLQTHANCPLCRSEITTTAPIAINSIIEENPNQDFAEMESMAFEVRDDEAQISTYEGNGSDDKRSAELRNGSKQPYVSSMGDEYIDRRSKGGEFEVQPMRRSFSMDSSNDRQLYIAVQEILQKNPHFQMVNSDEGSSSGSPARVKRSFFSFGHSRSSKNAVLPIQNEL